MTVSLDYEDYDLGSMTWEDAEEAIPDADFVVLPTGSIEQHSIHLPVTVDTLRAENLTRELVEAAPEHDLSMVRLPTLPYGYSEHHMPLAGTITLQPDTYREVLEQIARSVHEHGAKRLVIVNCHGGNREPMKLAADRVQRDTGLEVSPVHWTNFAREQLEERFGDDWGHAGDHETSVTELFHPDLVKEGKKEPQVRKAEYEARQYTYFPDITEQGGLGDPTNADPEFMADVVADTTESILETLKADIEEATKA
ncbi:MAG TPA: creatininase family protein [Natrialbaceae archaeon]|nr:creatininase family protein [Natrialbaceae archaeon]